MPESFYNEKAPRELIGRFKIVVGGMATGSLGHGSFVTRFGTGRRSTGQDRAGQEAMAGGSKAAENLTPRYAAGQAGTAPSAFRDPPFDRSGTRERSGMRAGEEAAPTASWPPTLGRPAYIGGSRP
jgi:hypothetical protein